MSAHGFNTERSHPRARAYAGADRDRDLLQQLKSLVGATNENASSDPPALHTLPREGCS